MNLRLSRAFLLACVAPLTACRVAGPPVPTGGLPADTAAVNQIQRADLVRVDLTNQERLELHQPSLEYPLLVGVDRNNARRRIPLDSVARLEVMEIDPSRTAGAVLLGAVGAAVLALAVIAATKESCPFVYTVTAEGPMLQGELYAGAIVPELARRDVLPLRTMPDGDQYVVSLYNHARETQYTDALALITVDHAEDVTVLPDPDGALHSVGIPLPPRGAVDGLGRDARAAVAELDGSAWVSEPRGRDRSNPDHLRDGLTLTFPKPVGAASAKLVLRIKNTPWTDHALAMFLSTMGDMMDAYYLGTGAEGRGARLERFMATQGLLLEVATPRDGAWRSIRHVYPSGPAAWRDMVLPIPAEDVEADSLVLRLRGGALFWAFDRIGIDYSPDTDLAPRRWAPIRAIQDDGTEVEGLLERSDGVYQVLPEPGRWVEVTFPYPERRAGMVRTTLLDSEGYYIIHQRRAGPPDREALAAIREDPDAFLRFSLDRYVEMLDASSAPLPDPPPGR